MGRRRRLEGPANGGNRTAGGVRCGSQTHGRNSWRCPRHRNSFVGEVLAHRTDGSGTSNRNYPVVATWLRVGSPFAVGQMAFVRVRGKSKGKRLRFAALED